VHRTKPTLCKPKTHFTHYSNCYTHHLFNFLRSKSHKIYRKGFFFKLQKNLGERSDDTPVQVRKFLLFRIQKVLISIYIYLSPFARKFTSIHIFISLYKAFTGFEFEISQIQDLFFYHYTKLLKILA
jgi:hypothetical protein